ncbi:DsbA family protein [Arthrobacter globiformis]|uniref:DsbA family protein n=1 Tax=Arthrobacter globiformis TaxID=1665 RepID=UPI00278A2CA7|nr:DsbA family protein [Arthrobacter globiformis]MDQ0867336.1 putative protein-disulfide isomerase [Arthrobacter globiformis]
MRFTYVFDAYCGWCYGFAPAVTELAAEEWVELRVISGGLFPASAIAALRDYPHIPNANARIAQLTGALFGDPYVKLLEDGDFIMNSDAAAVGLVALKDSGGDDLQMAHAMQTAFYKYGQDLSDVSTYIEIAQDHGLDSSKVVSSFYDSQTRQKAVAEQQEVRQLGIHAYPTLLAHAADGTYRIGGPASSGERLKQLAKEVMFGSAKQKSHVSHDA